MLNLRSEHHLGKVLKNTPSRIREVLSDLTPYFTELLWHDPSGVSKDRVVLNVTGEVRLYQERLLRLLVKKLAPSPYSHGCVRKRSVLTNVAPHKRSSYVFKADITKFYPSVSFSRVYRLFLTLGCTPDVARLCTRICTFNNHLALGLPTSPAIANELMKPVDKRIGGMCRRVGLKYSRFVDDLAISGRYDLAKSGIPRTVERILASSGFQMHPEKSEVSNTSAAVITGIQIRKGRFDVRAEYLEELERQIEDARSLSMDGHFDGPYFTDHQIFGRVHFVGWVNRGRKKQLLRRVKSIKWFRHSMIARERGLRACKPQLRPLGTVVEPDEPEPAPEVLTQAEFEFDSTAVAPF